MYVSNSSAACAWRRHEECGGKFGQQLLWLGCERALSIASLQENSNFRMTQTTSTFSVEPNGGISACTPINGWSNIIVPGKHFLRHSFYIFYMFSTIVQNFFEIKLYHLSIFLRFIISAIHVFSNNSNNFKNCFENIIFPR